MENIQLGDKILVIGATNRINSLDARLRRPGLFDKEIEIGIPNAQGRKEILSIILNKMSHNLTQANISHLASITHGYVGADLFALCQEAALKVVKKYRLKQHNSTEQLVVTIEDIVNAMTDILPSAMREVAIDVPKVKWEDIGGYHDVKQKLKEAIQWPILVVILNKKVHI